MYLKQKKNIFLYTCRVILIPFSEKNVRPRPALANMSPPLAPSHTKNGSPFAAAALFGGRRRGGSGSNGRSSEVVAHHWGAGSGGVLVVEGH
jgi:hypothetical protein